MVSNRLKSSLYTIHSSSRWKAGVPGSSDTLQLRAGVRTRACAADCVPWDGIDNPGEKIWTEDWTTNETRQIVARVEATEKSSERFWGPTSAGCLLIGCFAPRGLALTMCRLDSTRLDPGRGWMEGQMDGGLGSEGGGQVAWWEGENKGVSRNTN